MRHTEINLLPRIRRTATSQTHTQATASNVTKAACQGRLFISTEAAVRLAANHVDDELHPVAIGQRSLASRLLIVDEDDDIRTSPDLTDF